MSLYPALRPALFALDPERAHRLSVWAMALVGSLPPVAALLNWALSQPAAPAQVMGLTFPNRVGIAAGYDKDALAFRGLFSLGAGHVEVGTVTPRPQAGNDAPRVFRLLEDEAVINRLGFPGVGAQVVARRLMGRRPAGGILGVNLGKQKETPLEEALLDYEPLVGLFAPLCDYLAINVSSPNTPGLRQLQGRAYLEGLLRGIGVARAIQVAVLERPVPVAVKLSPDLDDAGLEEAVGVAMDCGMDGIIATNTTLARDGLRSPRSHEAGGLSGRPLTVRSLEVTRRISALTGGRIPLISAGGIMTVDDARARIDAGACLVQLYTGLIYRGPGLTAEIAGALAQPPGLGGRR